MVKTQLPPGFTDAVNFPLIKALTGRRARRFAVGANIPDGVLAYQSNQEPMPLSELETLTLLAVVGVTPVGTI